ncbi:MAG: (d)CMP kinase, partial [Alphaproteobacteria bacterium]|nr:(d)CMP kinase [Alphaproteobacteria bacterium]
FAAERGAVLDGRDIGTVIFPDATVKLFVTASLEARARRRALELAGRGIAADPATVEQEIRARDERDAGRAHAPLTAAPDAITLDTTGHDSDAVFGAACQIVIARLAAGGIALRHTGM